MVMSIFSSKRHFDYRCKYRKISTDEGGGGGGGEFGECDDNAELRNLNGHHLYHHRREQFPPFGVDEVGL